MVPEPQTISLNGNDWQIFPLLPNEWIWRRVWEREWDLRTWQPAVVGDWLPAVVPGCVQSDLWDAGLLPDPYCDLNSRAWEWTWDRDWLYAKEFVAPPALAGHVVRLHFEGVDYSCHVYLNGHHLGDHEGSYLPFEFDVTDRLRLGEPNRLLVVVDRAPDEQWQIGWTSQVRTWKARFAYGWDWCTRLVPLGLWDYVELRATGPAWVEDAWVRPLLADDFSSATVNVQCQIRSAPPPLAPVPEQEEVAQTVSLRGQGEVKPQRVRLSAVATLEDETVAETTVLTTLSPGMNTVTCQFRLDQPALWFPNTFGPQPLYQLALRLEDENGEVLDRRTETFGVRRIRFLPNEGGEEALPYTLEVNGQRLFSKGWNWAPQDQLYAREAPERYERLLQLARDAHVNLLRVWGGGLIEKRVFYDLCDRFGILVWQEFIQSSSGIDNRPPTDPAYLAMIEKQARQIVPRRRNHPSLALWCGGNELMHDDWTPLDASHPALTVLRDVVAELDPDRGYLPTSASGPCANSDRLKVGQMHDVHGPWKYLGPEEHYAHYNEIDPLLHSEFGVEGTANLRSLRRALSPENLWPPDRSNAAWTHHGSWWLNRERIESLFGPVEDLETFVQVSQFLQAEGLRYAVEANRRRKWRCSGTLPWQFNEPWPNTSCTNSVDHDGEPRPVYWWMKKAYEPIHVSARYDGLHVDPGSLFRAELWLNNSTPRALTVPLTARLIDLTGQELHRQVLEAGLGAACACRAGIVEAPVPEDWKAPFLLRLVAEATTGERLSANDYVFSTADPPLFAPLRDAPLTRLKATREGRTVALRNSGEAVALFVRLEPADSASSENFLFLEPGETVRLAVRGDGGAEIAGWNTNRLEV